MLAAVAKVPELAIEQSEASKMATAIANVARHYPQIEAAPVVIDWTCLAVTVAEVYGTRIAAYKMRMKLEEPPRLQVVNQ